MYIKKIILENFRNIKSGLKAKRLEIDFSNRENKICLIVGRNGIGKTSILSCLTPFATLGNLDVRNNNPLIIAKKQGYKNIVIIDNERNEIDIQHMYMPNGDTHTVKSYFKMNGKELNPNGNVTSFKELVSEILGIDMDYLKLIRIGSNVTNLIQLKATERKNFMSKMLDGVEVYLKLHKKVSTDARNIKLLISHSVDNLNKLKIDDISVFESETDMIEDSISKLDKESSDLSAKILLVQYKIKDAGCDDKTSFSELEHRFSDALKKKKKHEKILEKLSIDDIDLNETTKQINELTEKVIHMHAEVDALNIRLEDGIKNLDDHLSEESSLKTELTKELELGDVSSLNEHLKKLRIKHNDIYCDFKNYKPTFTKVEFDSFVVFLKNTQRMLNTTYEFGKGPVRDVIKMMKKRKSVRDFVASHLLSIENESNRGRKTYLDTLIDKYQHVKIDCDRECPYKSLHNEILRPLTTKPVSEAKKDSEYYHYVSMVNDNLEYIIKSFEEWKEFIPKLPEKIQMSFTVGNIFDNINKLGYIYNEKDINELMSYITEYDNFIKLEEEIKNTELEIQKIEAISKASYIEDRLNTIEKKKEELSSIITDTNYRMNELNENIIECEKTLEVLNDTKDALELHEETEKEVEELGNTVETVKSLLDDMDKYVVDKNMVDKKIIEMNDILRKRRMALDQYNKIMKELSKYKEVYDDLVVIRDSLSSKSGIPLLYVEMYLKDTVTIANELLDIVYDGDLYLDKFDLSGDTFNIPFIKNGERIDDVIYASQGEQSFLSQAISFALSAQQLDKYNIVLLDEVDSTFDRENRERAIDVLEHQGENIHAEQMFVISHNDMYSQYPVDILDLEHIEDNKFDIKLS